MTNVNCLGMQYSGSIDLHRNKTLTSISPWAIRFFGTKKWEKLMLLTNIVKC